MDIFWNYTIPAFIISLRILSGPGAFFDPSNFVIDSISVGRIVLSKNCRPLLFLLKRIRLPPKCCGQMMKIECPWGSVNFGNDQTACQQEYHAR